MSIEMIDHPIAWALRQNYHLDKSNAAIHQARTKFSPITFALFHALPMSVFEIESQDEELAAICDELRRHDGAYELDAGR